MYMSPEVIKDLPYNEKCDVYSFGVIMYELFYEVVPYHHPGEHVANLYLLTHEIIGGRRPIIPSDIEYSYTDKERYYLALMQLCWQRDSQVRPSFMEVCDEIERIQDYT